MLFLCATPIGNLKDITLRVLEALRECDAVLAEDTRRARKLLTHYDIHKRVESFNQINERKALPRIVARLKSGENLALVSDAGMPGISDPGFSLVRACLSENLLFEVLPGPSSILTALVASGLPAHQFTFAGFPPRGASQRKTWIEQLLTEPRTVVFFESPRRLSGLLTDIAARFPSREVVVARELTKVFEEFVRGTAADILKRVSDTEIRGEIVVVVGPAGPVERASDEEIAEMVAERASSMGRRAAAKEVGRLLGLASGRVYEVSLKKKR